MNNLYVSDSAAQTVYQIDPIAGVERALPLGALVSPTGLAIDPTGNLLVADPGAPAIYRFNFATGVRTTVSSPAVAPTAALTDAAGNLLIADTASILAVPASGNSAPFTVASLTPCRAGHRLGRQSLHRLRRGRAQARAYARLCAVRRFLAPQTVNLLESGNQAFSATLFSQTDTSDYALAPTGSTDCAINSSGSGMLAIGGLCALTATYTPTTYSTTTDTVTFNGNLSNAALSMPSSVALVLTGPSTPPAATIALGAFMPASPIYGQPVTLSATVTGASVAPLGTVVFTVDNSTYTTNLSNGQATTIVTGLAAGSHNVSAAYTSSNGYAAAMSAAATLVIAQAAPAITWSTPAPITYGTPLTSAQLDATSTVAGTFTYTPPASTIVGAGPQTLSVLLTPNNLTDYSSATQTVVLTVNKASSVTTLSAGTNPAAQGQAELLTASVSGAGRPGGTVIFLSGATTLCTSTLNGSGVAACSFTPATSGPLSLTAQYQGDANHLASSANLALNVYDTLVSEQFASTQLVYPGATNVTVCVTGDTRATPTGTVQIDDRATPLTTLTLQGNGCAYWYISPGLSAGEHSITAVYSGDRNNPSGSSAPTVLTVSPVPVNLAVSCWNASFPYGGNYQCTVNVSSNAGPAKGSITYAVDGGAQTAIPLSNGNAQFALTEPPAGNHTVIIGYAQQTNYAAASSQTEKFTVTAAPTLVLLTPSTWFATVGTNITFHAAVTSWSAGAPSDNGAVSFYNGSTLLATVPVDSSGQASYTTSSLRAGIQTITATYAGGNNYATSLTSVMITLVP